ncbi:MAG: hypothetical protein LUE64_03260 [Candidatus Gastranaerophilales bacterium]|nr:hypothetical protein [Candidatus Gastranaerophilales bacterium]
MEYVNFSATLPISAYLWLEETSRRKKLSKNEILNTIIFACKITPKAGFKVIKNAGFYNSYNKK